MIGTTLAILSLAGSAAGMAGSAVANKKAERELAQRRKELDLEYRYDYNLDFLNTPQAKSALSQLSQEYIRRAKQVAQGNAIIGASNERAVAQSEAMQRPFTETISRLAGYGQQRQDAIRSRWLQGDQYLADLQYKNMQQQGQNWADFGTNALNAGVGFAEAEAAGSFEGIDSWFKGLGAGRRVDKDIAANPVSSMNVFLKKNKKNW